MGWIQTGYILGGGVNASGTSESSEIGDLGIRDHRCAGLSCSFVIDLLLAAVFAAQA